MGIHCLVIAHQRPREMQPDADRHIDWDPFGEWSYHEFLKGKQLEAIHGEIKGGTKLIRVGIDTQTKQLIGSTEQFLRRGFGSLQDDVGRGLTILSRDVRDVGAKISAGTAELSSALRWGLTTIAASVGQMNDSLQQINATLQRIDVKLERSAQTWAFEQFAIARDEFKRGLYPEALETVTRAIHGHGSNTGYNSEFRFHFLLGAIRLGSWIGEHANTSDEIVKPDLAEEAFLKAARYCRGVKTGERAEALFRAGRSASFQGAFTRAIDHTRKGLAELTPEQRGLRAAGHYQLARLLCVCGADYEDAALNLRAAFDLELALIVEAGAERGIFDRGDVFPRVFAEKTQELRDVYGKLAEGIGSAMSRWKQFKLYDVNADDVGVLGAEIQQVEQTLSNAEAEARNGGPFDYESAIAILREGLKVFPKFPEQFRRRLDAHLSGRERSLREDHFSGAREVQVEARRIMSELSKARSDLEACNNDVRDRRNKRAWRVIAGLALLTLTMIALLQLAVRISAGEESIAHVPVLIIVSAVGLFGFVLLTSFGDGDQSYLVAVQSSVKQLEKDAVLAGERATLSMNDAGASWSIREKALAEEKRLALQSELPAPPVVL
jgi:tetratricopeptide (TPR) repeat protein